MSEKKSEIEAVGAGDVLVTRALAFVAEFKGDQRCGLNCMYAEALAAEVHRLRAEVADTRSRPSLGWQPIESAPTDHEGDPIIAWDGSEVHFATRGFTNTPRRAGWFDEKNWLIHPTHWMPLPSAPPPPETT